MVYTLKALRNIIAHNDMVYDTCFRKMDPSRPMKPCLILETELPTSILRQSVIISFSSTIT